MRRFRAALPIRIWPLAKAYGRHRLDFQSRRRIPRGAVATITTSRLFLRRQSGQAASDR
jgi:hypothetical protein